MRRGVPLVFVGIAIAVLLSLRAATVGAGDYRRTCRAVGPSTDLQGAVDRNPPGTTFCITRGVHRLLTFVVPKTGDVFAGSRGAVLNGSVELHGIQRYGDVWSVRLTVPLNPEHPGVCAASAVCGYANDVFVNGRPLRRVDNPTALSPNAFYISADGHTLLLGRDPAHRKVEIAIATRAFKGWKTGADAVVIEGLTIEKFANEAGIGAINGRPSWHVLDDIVRLNHGIGVQDAGVITGNRIYENGQLGVMESFADGAQITDNVISSNNYAGFDPSWEAGGAKWVMSSHLTIRHNTVRGNHGAGLWTDWRNQYVTYSGNDIENNTGSGIFHEASYDATISNNKIVGNGSAGGTGTLADAGISMNDSQNVQIYGNTLSGNRNGIGLTQTDRGSTSLGPLVTQNDYIHNNTITHSGRTGLVQWVSDASYYTSRNNRFQANTYAVRCDATPFIWQDPNNSLLYSAIGSAQWIADGNDTTGHFSVTC